MMTRDEELFRMRKGYRMTEVTAHIEDPKERAQAERAQRDRQRRRLDREAKRRDRLGLPIPLSSAKQRADQAKAQRQRDAEAAPCTAATDVGRGGCNATATLRQFKRLSARPERLRNLLNRQCRETEHWKSQCRAREDDIARQRDEWRQERSDLLQELEGWESQALGRAKPEN